MSDSDIPASWHVRPLSECVDVLDRKRKPVNAKERAERPGPVPYYGATGQVGWIDDYLFDEELVLLGEDGAPFSDKSKPIAYVIDGRSWVNNHAHVLRAHSNVTTNRFMKYYLDAFDFTGYVQGSTRDKLNQGAMKTIPVVMPLLEHQQALVRLLDGLFDRRRSVSAHLSAAERAVDVFRQAVLAAACSGRLTADWRDSAKPVESADDLIERSRAAVLRATTRRQAQEAWSPPDWLDIPPTWTWAPLRDLALVRGGIQKQPKRAPKGNSFPYLRVANVMRGSLRLDEMVEFELFGDELRTYGLEPGDLLVVEGNGSPAEIGRAAIWHGEIADCVHQNHIIRARPVGLLPEFLENIWNSPIGSREIASLAVTSAGLYSLSTKKIGAVPIPVAPLEEQLEIVRRTEALLAIADQLLVRIEGASRRVERTSQAVLAKAFRGDLIPTAIGLET